MHDIIAHNPLTNTYLIPKEWSACFWVTPHTLYPGMMFYSKEHPFDQFGSAILAILPPSFLCTSSLAENGTLQSLLFRVSTTVEQPTHQCVINVIFTLNPEHSIDQVLRRTLILSHLKQGQLGRLLWQGTTSFREKIHFPTVKAQASP